jgi:XRE family transcriptional regulator, regulator of sulfur utilization
MAKSFDDLASAAKQAWSDDARHLYEAASEQFREELAQRAELGAQIAAARKSRGLSQPDLSARSGVQQAEISRIERGVGNPTARTLLRLANALDRRVTLVPHRG